MAMRKSQNSFEFILILMFILIVVGIIMVILGEYLVDVSREEVEAEVNDFNNKIQSELNLLTEVEGGYYREVEISENLMNRFNLTINVKEGYFYLRDYEAYTRTDDIMYYYEIPLGLNVTLENVSGKYFLALRRDRQDVYEGINLS
jgi:uncharacterized membrane protein YgaE (UPF0421/DUF939 family)